MKAVSLTIQGIILLEPKVFCDGRGYFFESFNQKTFEEIIGLSPKFVQDNHSRSSKGVLRGLHYQIRQPQGKLVRVVKGCVLDVVVDLRKKSSTFGHHISVELSDNNYKQLWVPVGFAHGFIVLSDVADLFYKTTDYYAPHYERCIKWDDSDLNIDWQLNGTSPIISKKDSQGGLFKNTEYFE